MEFIISMYNTQISAWEIRGIWPLMRPSLCVPTMTIPFPCACAYVSMTIKRDGQVHRFGFPFCGKFMQALGRAAADREVRLAQFATGFLLLNHQAELR